MRLQRSSTESSPPTRVRFSTYVRQAQFGFIAVDVALPNDFKERDQVRARLEGSSRLPAAVARIYR